MHVLWRGDEGQGIFKISYQVVSETNPELKQCLHCSRMNRIRRCACGVEQLELDELPRRRPDTAAKRQEFPRFMASAATSSTGWRTRVTNLG
jgi:hypothetical protein